MSPVVMPQPGGALVEQLGEFGKMSPVAMQQPGGTLVEQFGVIGRMSPPDTLPRGEVARDAD